MKPELIIAFREYIEARFNYSESINDKLGVIHWREEMQKLDRIETGNMVISIVELISGVDDVTPEMSFDDTVIDSLDKIETIMMVEQQFDIEINDHDLDLIKTIGDLVELTIKTKEGE